MADKKDVVIIGSGPAGLSAAVYAKRAMLDAVVIEKEFSGGQIVTTDRVDNYLGLYGEDGFSLATKFKEHADALGVTFIDQTVTEIKDLGKEREVLLEDGTVISTKAVLFATGASHRNLGVPGEERLNGAGVSYCATCDGAFFRNRTVAVVGGGDVALEDALYLSNLCEKVYLIHRRSELRGAKVYQEQIEQKENITFLPECEITEILGENKVEAIKVADHAANEEKKLEVAGIFLAVGTEPKSTLARPHVNLDEAGYIVAGEDGRTSKKGFYAAGDVRTKPLRQVITAAADGATAIASIEQDLYA